MGKFIPLDTLAKWLDAWALSRELAPPTRFKSGYRIDVGYERQKARYIFQELNDDFIELSETIHETWVFLKVCAALSEAKSKISERWVIQPQGYMMSCIYPMDIPDTELPKGYRIEFDHYNSTTVVKIVAHNGALASIGRLIIVDDLAVYDRISTEENHRRKGLATFLMKELERIAIAKGIHKNFLVATEQGKLLYQSLGWQVDCLYTSIVIPG
ncbi:GNAT family N-acetyltransferase [Sphingobacterium sp. HMA12]|jgi:GNAT superfamily N-acetyltransferase|uniref:GNAT family N-acetyltransferase n=1 Tax=Sphingobacterium sp. HMA12 TaxID=2050894 RepID=UPI000CE9E6AA|nr:GNAT family N-acetyltransferase [Sphingobacterium sp. HMA12]